MNILVSACLIGVKCRYDGECKPDRRVLGLMRDNALIPVCPEQLGGLPTPRPPAERLGGRVITKDQADVTRQYADGASEAVRLAKLFGCRYAVLKSKSPSCGCGRIYDGSFGSRLIAGDGVTAEALKEAGVMVVNEDGLDELHK